MWPVSGPCLEGLFQYLSKLMLVCAQPGRVLGREWKTDRASSAKTHRKGLKDNNNRLLGIVNKICIPFGTEIKISICGGLDGDCTEVTLHQVANFRVKHPNSDSEKPGGVYY